MFTFTFLIMLNVILLCKITIRTDCNYNVRIKLRSSTYNMGYFKILINIEEHMHLLPSSHLHIEHNVLITNYYTHNKL